MGLAMLTNFTTHGIFSLTYFIACLFESSQEAPSCPITISPTVLLVNRGTVGVRVDLETLTHV